jgi:hypothetical protein
VNGPSLEERLYMHIKSLSDINPMSDWGEGYRHACRDILKDFPEIKPAQEAKNND